MVVTLVTLTQKVKVTFTQFKMVDCAIVCDVTFVLLKLRSLLFLFFESYCTLCQNVFTVLPL